MEHKVIVRAGRQQGKTETINGIIEINCAVREAMLENERKAWKALAGYKFWMFGYHAAQWVMLNRVGKCKHRNPFKGLVKYARTILVNNPEGGA